MDLAPVVTGISPIDGVPGTKVTIRGENFGNSPEDLAGLIICGVDCLMSAEWKSPNKIVARCGAGTGKGDIIVITVQGGRGTSTVQFKGYQEAMGPLKESAVWVDESIFLNWAFGRKRPMSPNSSLQEDPLGLSVEGNEHKVLDDDLEDMFPGLCGDMSSPRFSPEWFLLKNHLSTSYDDLRAGLACLRRKVQYQKESQISFLKANVGSVLEQLDTLQELKCKFESDIHLHGRQSTDILQKAILSCKAEGNKLFDDVLQRKDQADGTRNALNVLHRFRFLLYLPVNIERNIQKGDYDVVINDYARAKLLFGDTQIPLFRRFYEEVEKRINDLRNILLNQLTTMPALIENQKKLIRNLNHLEVPGDPAWNCLGVQHDYLVQLLIEARDSYLTKEIGDHDMNPSRKNSVVYCGIGFSSKTSTPAAKYNKIMSSSVGEWQATAPYRVIFVEDICDIISCHFPDFWKLSQAYFAHELLPSNVVIESSKKTDCQDMILDILHVYSDLIRGSIMPHLLDFTEGNYKKYHVWPEVSLDQLAPWLPQVVRHVRGCYNFLLALELPNEVQDIVKELLLDLRVHCLTSLFQQTIEHIKCLYAREDWVLDVDDAEGGRTQLPVMCEGIIVECAQLVKETALEASSKESVLLLHPTVKKNISTLIGNMLIAFAHALKRLTLQDPDEVSENQKFQDSLHKDASVTVPPFEVQLLITLSNCAYMRRVVQPRISENLIRICYPSSEVKMAMEEASKVYTELQDRLFEAYLEERVDPIIGTIERSMYLGHYDYGRVSHKPNDVRTYIKEILINISHVHAEVVRVWPELVHTLLCRVVDGVGEEISRLFSCIQTWSSNGALQGHIDIGAVMQALQSYTSRSAMSFFQEALDTIPVLTKENMRVKYEVLGKFEQDMKFVLTALDTQDSPQLVTGISI